ncbi:MAG: tripartite tricarboxylate transporter substrate binding protein [Undibacterium curvum]|uniref:tripartite tricarboxylate transporter substrate binding protein n=1 Tax=Undibacterium curvum TaxID=2762294 RepID=UPI003BC05327
MKLPLRLALLLCSPLWIAGVGMAATNTSDADSRCVVPAKPGGGMDLTCKLIQKSLTPGKVQLSYLPGGVGAVAWTSVLSQRLTTSNTLVAFSGGSLLNIAEGKFGKADTSQVRWVAAIGTDYGMIAVRRDSPYKTLRELMEAMRKRPANFAIAAGGTVGSQDWLKMAQIGRLAGIDPKALKLVAFEGGGESFTALMANHVQVVSGDVSEAALHAKDGDIRVLAVLSDARLPGVLENIPTAREQGFDVTWPIIRGVYMGPQTSDREYQQWVQTFERLMNSASFAEQRKAVGLYPFSMTGKQLSDYIEQAVVRYRSQAREFGMIR